MDELDNTNDPVTVITLADRDGPTVTFDSVPMAGVSEEQWSITLVATRWTTMNATGQSLPEHAVAGYLRGTMSAMLRLRNVINSLEATMSETRQPGADLGVTLQ